MKPLVIFDLDGTLADSKGDLCTSVNHVRREFGLHPLEESVIASMVGDGVTVLIERALQDGVEADGKKGLRIFLEYYRDHMLDETRLYPGVESTLDALERSCSLAVLTNKPIRFSRRMLEGLGIHDRFSAIYGGNSLPRKKPDPMGIFQILSDTRGERAATWMVGDSAIDVQAGRAAGVRTCGVTYGYSADTFQECPPDHLIDEFTQLSELVLTSVPER